jgi:hypothetical protein
MLRIDFRLCIPFEWAPIRPLYYGSSWLHRSPNPPRRITVLAYIVTSRRTFFILLSPLKSWSISIHHEGPRLPALCLLIPLFVSLYLLSSPHSSLLYLVASGIASGSSFSSGIEGAPPKLASTISLFAVKSSMMRNSLGAKYLGITFQRRGIRSMIRTGKPAGRDQRNTL